MYLESTYITNSIRVYINLIPNKFVNTRIVRKTKNEKRNNIITVICKCKD